MAIHQPNFFPWLGYFNKIARADVFIVLDDVQYQKTGSSWSNRVKVLVAGESRWITAPIRRPAHGVQTLAEIEWDPQPWREKLLRTLHMNYARAPHYREAITLLEPLVVNPEPRLLAYNVHAVRTIACALGIGGAFALSSEFGAAATGTGRLIDLAYKAGCPRYLVGGGAGGYQEDALFAAAGVELEYQAFVHPAYPQQGAAAFVPGLSIIDVLMNRGLALTRELLLP